MLNMFRIISDGNVKFSNYLSKQKNIVIFSSYLVLIHNGNQALLNLF